MKSPGIIDSEARSTVKERSIALKKKGKEKKENEAKMKEEPKKMQGKVFSFSHQFVNNFEAYGAVRAVCYTLILFKTCDVNRAAVLRETWQFER